MCTGQEFTERQWTEYIERHQLRGTTPVFTYKTFGYNIWDVCVSPNTPVHIKTKLCEFEIYTAESPCGRWEYGLTLDTCSRCCTHGALFVAGKDLGYPSEKDAIYEALVFAEERAENELNDIGESGCPGTETYPPALRQFLAEVRRYKDIYDPAQLSLFDL